MTRIAGIMAVAALLLALVPADQARAAEAQRESDVIIVSGQGEARVAPDTALVRVGVETRSQQAARAIQENNRLMGQVIQAIQRADIPEQNIQTVVYNVSQQYEPVPTPTPDAGRQPQRLIYVVHNIVSVRVPNPAQAGAVIDAATGAGANVVQGISFISSRAGEARAQALRDAVQDARAKAEVLTGALGVRIVAVENVTESSGPIFVPQRLEAAAVRADAGAPISPGENTIQASVTVRYRIAK